MTFTVFQVDHTESLVPFSYEMGLLEAAGGRLVEGRCTSEAEVIERAADADVLWLSWQPDVSRAMLQRLPRCRLVVRWGIGFDQIDLSAATDLGVAVANCPTYGTVDVAEHALGLLLAAARRIPMMHEDVRGGGWSMPPTGAIRRVRGATLGLVGVGLIGSAFAELARGVGLEVIGFDPNRPHEQLRQSGIEPVGMDELLRRADFLSLHVPLTPTTAGMVDATWLRGVKPGAILLNTSRGAVVDEEALLDALDEGRLAGAALDVFQVEPLPGDNRLRRHPDVVLTPHYAGVSPQSWQALRDEMCATTIEFMATGWAPTIVNPDVRGRTREPSAT